MLIVALETEQVPVELGKRFVRFTREVRRSTSTLLFIYYGKESFYNNDDTCEILRAALQYLDKHSAARLGPPLDDDTIHVWHLLDCLLVQLGTAKIV